MRSGAPASVVCRGVALSLAEAISLGAFQGRLELHLGHCLEYEDQRGKANHADQEGPEGPRSLHGQLLFYGSDQHEAGEKRVPQGDYVRRHVHEYAQSPATD